MIKYNKTIKIKDNLFLVEVPKDISYFDIEHEIMDKKKCSLRLYNSADWQLPLIPLEYAIHKIHGLITTPELTFNFEYGTGGYDKMILKERIQKAIQDEGLLLVNPYKKPDNYELWQKYGSFTQYGESLSIHSQQWKESESKVVKGNLLLIEKIN